MDRNRAFRQYAATYLFSAFVLIGCAGRLPDDVAPLPSNNTYVQNGIVHEQATIAGLQPHDRLILPEGTKVERSDTNADPLVLIEKKQQIYAHPPQPILIEETPKKLKVYVLREAGSATVATLGEHMIEGHGGTSIQLSVVLPDRLHLEVEFAPNLIGPGSKLNPLKRQGDEALGQWSELETTSKR